MRQLGSKLLAGGLSAGVILLWWPAFFATDSVTTWLLRGIAWTLSFELLLVALSPFELALWSTRRGERLTRRVDAGRALLEHHSPRRRIGRRAALAVGALAVPLALIALGVSSHIPSHPGGAVAVTRVTRVVRVVKPVEVQRVVKVENVAQAPLATAYTPARPVPSVIPRRRSAMRTHKPATTPAKPAPVAHIAPKADQHPGQPSAPSSGSTPQPTAPAAPPASGSQTS